VGERQKMVEALVTGEWVRSCIADGAHPFKVVDCSWFLVPPAVPHQPVLAGTRAHFGSVCETHPPPPTLVVVCVRAGAAYFDVDQVADRSEDKSPSPHMLPSPRQFAAWMDRHGISP
jgi:3-mercaptopyruvate sulfurtransferase SseA